MATKPSFPTAPRTVTHSQPVNTTTAKPAMPTPVVQNVPRVSLGQGCSTCPGFARRK